MQKITPFLWFDDNADQAMKFYTTVFKDAKIISEQRYSEAGRGEPENFMSGTMQINGQEVMFLNGGPVFKLNEAFSFFVSCEGQAEVDELWDKLTADGGEESQCGWLKDKFGVSWQIIPTALGKALSNPDPEKAAKAIQAMLKMKKIDVSALEEATK